MFSDDLCDVIEQLWEHIADCDYSHKYKEDLIRGIASLQYVVYKTGRIQGEKNIPFSKMVSVIKENWDQNVAEGKTPTSVDQSSASLWMLS